MKTASLKSTYPDHESVRLERIHAVTRRLQEALDRAYAIRSALQIQASGGTLTRAANAVGTDAATLLRWIRQFETHGAAGLLDGRVRSGRRKRSQMPQDDLVGIKALGLNKLPASAYSSSGKAIPEVHSEDGTA